MHNQHSSAGYFRAKQNFGNCKQAKLLHIYFKQDRCVQHFYPYSLFQNFSFQSGKDVDKFKDYTDDKRGANGVRYLEEYTNTYLSGKVVQQIDLGSHIMFIADVTDGVKLSDKPTVTYDYYQKNIKPKAKKPTESTGNVWVCKICGWTYDESKGMPEKGIPAGTKFEDLPEDFFCPLCKHPKSDFEKM